MRPSQLLLPLTAALAGPAVASGATISHALKAVGRETAALGRTVSGWRGDLLGALPIVGNAGALLLSLQRGASVAEDSSPLSVDESLAVAGDTQKLADTVNKTLEAVIRSKPAFDGLFLGPLLYLTLEVEKAAADDLIANVIAKVPKELQPIAEDIVKRIKDGFQKTLHAYSY